MKKTTKTRRKTDMNVNPWHVLVISMILLIIFFVVYFLFFKTAVY